MSYNFPNGPTVGQLFTPAGGPIYTWDGVAWGVSDPGSAPADGNEYAMVNGVWRLKSQSFDLAGKASQDVTVPEWGPSAVQLKMHGLPVSAGTPITSYLRGSADGTTFLSGATDYSQGGFYHCTGTLAFQPSGWAATSALSLAHTSDNINIGNRAEATLQLVRPSTTVGGFSSRVRGESYNSAATHLLTTFMYGGYAVGASWGLTIKAIRVLTSPNTYASGRLIVEWLV